MFILMRPWCLELGTLCFFSFLRRPPLHPRNLEKPLKINTSIPQAPQKPWKTYEKSMFPLQKPWKTNENIILPSLRHPRNLEKPMKNRYFHPSSTPENLKKLKIYISIHPSGTPESFKKPMKNQHLHPATPLQTMKNQYFHPCRLRTWHHYEVSNWFSSPRKFFITENHLRGLPPRTAQNRNF